jgi:hypothetical protein
MAEQQQPDWIDSLSEALPGRDRREIEGWAVWFKTLWSDSDRALELLRLAAQPGGLGGGPTALLRHLEAMGRHDAEVEAHLRRLAAESTGAPVSARVAGELDAQALELKMALRLLIGTLDDVQGDASSETRQELRDQLGEAIREASALREKLGDA